MSIGRIEALAITGPTRLRLQWDDGHSASVDLAAVAGSRPALQSLLAPDSFAAARLASDGWSVEWPDGIDFGSGQLRRWADEEAGETMSAAAFRSWIERHSFTLERAADALGLSRRTIAYYLSGAQAIPRTVMLATLGFDRSDAA